MDINFKVKKKKNTLFRFKQVKQILISLIILGTPKLTTSLSNHSKNIFANFKDGLEVSVIVSCSNATH